jgi:hypothetical protein
VEPIIIRVRVLCNCKKTESLRWSLVEHMHKWNYIKNKMLGANR